MKKRYKIYEKNNDWLAIDLIEDNETVGGWIIPIRPYIEGLQNIIVNTIEKDGYIEYEKTNHPN